VTTRAIAFDFNGTLSDDEPLLAAIFAELFAEHGKPLSEQEYFDFLAGHSDEEIVVRWLGRDHPAVETVVRERVERYRAAAADGSRIDESVREAVRYAAERAPIALVTGAARAEVEPVLSAAGLIGLFRAIVTADDVEQGKPHPEGYENALARLGVLPQEGVAVEDTEAGIASAKAAGMRVVAKRGTLAPDRLAQADEVVDAIDVTLIQRLLD
jgi:beta-phosphoglucomutase